MLGYEILSKYPNISHFVTTRLGGYSKGNYGSFNCTSYTGDDPKAVKANKELLIDSLLHKPTALIIPKQVHSTNISIINSPDKITGEALQGIDALITDKPGYCICISTADCIPVLLYDFKSNIVAAIHAGWRGTVNGIVPKTLHLMNQNYHSDTKNIIACIGPGISQECFEVGNEVYDIFKGKSFDMDRIANRNPESGKYHIDLWQAITTQLTDFGIPVNQIECAGICTFKNDDTFFSARKLGINSGRILSGIMINNK